MHTLSDGGMKLGVVTEDVNTGSRRLRWDILGDGQAVGEYDATAQRGRYYHRDHLGSIRVKERWGAVLQAQDYYPFGGLMPGRQYQSGVRTSAGYTGHEQESAACALTLATPRILAPVVWTLFVGKASHPARPFLHWLHDCP